MKHINHTFKKILETILFIAGKAPIPDKFHIAKILYFADKYHLEKYGRTICNDYYIAMDGGPVPSKTYDLIKDVEGKGWTTILSKEAKESFKVEGHFIKPLREANSDYLSESDMECIIKAINNYGNMTFEDLKKESHDEAYNSADQDGVIPLQAIINTLDDAESILDYISN